jgi:hypothetical protein
MSRQESIMVLHLPTRFKFQEKAMTGCGIDEKTIEETKDKKEDPSTAVIPILAGIAEPTHKISNIGRPINIAV